MTRTSARCPLPATDAADLVAIERAQQLRLRVEGQVADLVEEQRAPWPRRRPPLAAHAPR
jgi:hypothetical protein